MLLRAFFCSLILVVSHAATASLPDFTEIVEDSSPAVVKVMAEVRTPTPDASNRMEQLEELDQLPDALKRFFQYRNPPAPRGGSGSGFIISEDGYIVTNHHVVDGADRVIVRLSDRREYDAEVIGTDQRSDLALLRVDADELPFLKLGKSVDLKVGQWVLAIGSPFGLDYSVTAGIVSAKGRSLPTERGENYVPFIQTDVAINPGNSGGPLFNLEGEVIGVNSQIFTRSGGSIGLSFAIPSKVVRNIINQLRENGEVVRGWLGVSIQNVDRTLAESFGLDRPRGALFRSFLGDLLLSRFLLHSLFLHNLFLSRLLLHSLLLSDLLFSCFLFNRLLFSYLLFGCFFHSLLLSYFFLNGFLHWLLSHLLFHSLFLGWCFADHLLFGSHFFLCCFFLRHNGFGVKSRELIG